MRGMVKIYVRPLKIANEYNPGVILNKLKSIGFLASCLSTYDFSITLLPHDLIKNDIALVICAEEMF